MAYAGCKSSGKYYAHIDDDGKYHQHLLNKTYLYLFRSLIFFNGRTFSYKRISFLLIQGLYFLNQKQCYWAQFVDSSRPLMTRRDKYIRGKIRLEKVWWWKKKEIVFCYQNCSDLLWEKNVLVIEKCFCKFSAFSLKFQKLFLDH